MLLKALLLVAILSVELTIQQENPCLNNDGRGFYPVPDDATKYIQCSFGRMFVRECPPSLVWNNDLMYCGHTTPSLRARLLQRQKASMRIESAPVVPLIAATISPKMNLIAKPALTLTETPAALAPKPIIAPVTKLTLTLTPIPISKTTVTEASATSEIAEVEENQNETGLITEADEEEPILLTDETADSLIAKQKELLENLRKINEKLFSQNKPTINAGSPVQTPTSITLNKPPSVTTIETANVLPQQTPKFIKLNSVQPQTLTPIAPVATTQATSEVKSNQFEDSGILNSLQSLAVLKPTQNQGAVNQIRKLNTEGDVPVSSLAQSVVQSVPIQNPAKPILPPTTLPIVQPLPQPIAQPMPQPIAQPLPQPISLPIALPLPQPIAQSLPQPIRQPIPQPLPQPIAQPLPQPIAQPMPQSMLHQVPVNQDQIHLQMQAVDQQFQTADHQVVNVGSCKRVTCPTGHDCVVRNDCPTCNPSCNPTGNVLIERLVPLTCSMIRCPAGFTCMLDLHDNSLQCVM